MSGGATRKELFALERGDGRYYLYAPLQRTVAVVNAAAVTAVDRYLSAGIDGCSEAQQAVIHTLLDQGVVPVQPEVFPTFPESREFRPHEVTLFLTSRCNLRCRYCYADAGRKSIDMPWEVARAAIDLVAENAGWLGSDKLAVGFHGGGEPTLAWGLMLRCVDHTRERAEQLGIDAEIYCATNGLLSEEHARIIAERFTTVNVSIDGPAEIQNRARPTLGGDGSYPVIARTLRLFREHGVDFGLRATVTESTVARMVEIVEHLTERFRPAYLHLEPAWQCGRCHTTGETPPSDAAFIEHFVAAARRAGQLGVPLHYSGARLDVLTSKFCAAPGDGFSVLPEGLVTSCYEITEPDDPRAEIFHYGRYDSTSGRFRFDEARLERLRGYSVERIPHCADCFCRWHCAGDCLAKVLERSGSTRHEGSLRCELNRTLTLHALDDLVRAAQSGQEQEQEQEQPDDRHEGRIAGDLDNDTLSVG